MKLSFCFYCGENSLEPAEKIQLFCAITDIFNMVRCKKQSPHVFLPREDLETMFRTLPSTFIFSFPRQSLEIGQKCTKRDPPRHVVISLHESWRKIYRTSLFGLSQNCDLSKYSA